MVDLGTKGAGERFDPITLEIFWSRLVAIVANHFNWNGFGSREFTCLPCPPFRASGALILPTIGINEVCIHP